MKEREREALGPELDYYMFHGSLVGCEEGVRGYIGISKDDFLVFNLVQSLLMCSILYNVYCGV